VSASGAELSSAQGQGGRSLSPAGVSGGVTVNVCVQPTSPSQRCTHCGSLLMSFGTTPSAMTTSTPGNMSETHSRLQSNTSESKLTEDGEKVFLRPSNPPTPKAAGSASQPTEDRNESPK